MVIPVDRESSADEFCDELDLDADDNAIGAPLNSSSRDLPPRRSQLRLLLLFAESVHPFLDVALHYAEPIPIGRTWVVERRMDRKPLTCVWSIPHIHTLRVTNLNPAGA